MTSNPHPPAEGELRTEKFRRCLNNEGYPASLEVGRLYHALPDGDEILVNMVRVVDESGESYLYPGPMFSREVYEVSTAWVSAEMDRLRAMVWALEKDRDNAQRVADELRSKIWKLDEYADMEVANMHAGRHVNWLGVSEDAYEATKIQAPGNPDGRAGCSEDEAEQRKGSQR